jgi:hypothetical protein
MLTCRIGQKLPSRETFGTALWREFDGGSPFIERRQPA